MRPSEIKMKLPFDCNLCDPLFAYHPLADPVAKGCAQASETEQYFPGERLTSVASFDTLVSETKIPKVQKVDDINIEKRNCLVYHSQLLGARMLKATNSKRLALQAPVRAPAAGSILLQSCSFL